MVYLLKEQYFWLKRDVGIACSMAKRRRPAYKMGSPKLSQGGARATKLLHSGKFEHGK